MIAEALLHAGLVGALVSMVVLVAIAAGRVTEHAARRRLLREVVGHARSDEPGVPGPLGLVLAVGTIGQDSLGRSIASTRWGRRAAERLSSAGLRAAHASAWAAGVVVCSALSAALGFALGSIVAIQVALVASVAAILLAVLWTSSLLDGVVRARRAAVARELPLAIDVMAAALGAGAHVDRAMLAYVSTSGGPLADDLRETLVLLQAGYRREEAYRRVSARCGVTDMTAFLTELSRIGEQGSVDAATLRVMAADVRGRQRHWVQERAARAPIQMLFPIALLIMPALFLIVLGPVVVRLISGTFI